MGKSEEGIALFRKYGKLSLMRWAANQKVIIFVASCRMNKTVLILAALGLSAASLPGFAASPADTLVPLPFVRPDAPASAPSPMDALIPTPEVTGAIPRMNRVAPASMLKTGLDALTANDAAAALAARNSLPDGSLDEHILTWAIATSGLSGVPSGEIAAAQRKLKGWPGLTSFRSLSERAMYRENPAPADVLAAFGTSRPQTTEGAIILSRALGASGRAAEATRILRAIWVSEPLDRGMEDRILAEFPTLFTPDDHKARMDCLMYRGRLAQAKRFGDMGNAASLYKAWTGVTGNAKNAEALLAAVEKPLTSDPAYLFARVELLRRQDKYPEAAQLLQKVPREPARLLNPSEWWNEQRIIARGLADAGNFAQAYATVAGSVAESAPDRADADFHAGWYALRALNNPALAETHFRRILEASSRPLSASRAWYWLGRTAEAGGPGNAHEFYTKAAHYPGTFYGQLAAARMDIRTLDLTYPTTSDEDRARFARREAVQAIARLDAAGHDRRAASLYKALAEEMDSPGELALLAARAESQGDHALSLQIGKSAFGRGVDVAALAFPVGVIPAAADIGGSGKALAYAIARQESAFNPAAVSPANARGLLQILPGTAQGVAKRHGISFRADRLTTDAAYNATLGAHYLGEQIGTFGGSYILTFIAYNAGPKRVNEWIARYGDPRGKPIDEVVDWIERIPFPETRNYVQRVMENYQVYKTRLGETADIETDLRFGRQ
jgi:soluble lytic murein transglycosylase